MKRIVAGLVFISIFLGSIFSLYAEDVWATAGKVLTGVIIGYGLSEAMKSHGKERRVEIIEPARYEYKVYIPGRWKEYYVMELKPGRFEKVLIKNPDGTYTEREEWIPPTTTPVKVREWIPGRWETRYGYCR